MASAEMEGYAAKRAEEADTRSIPGQICLADFREARSKGKIILCDGSWSSTSRCGGFAAACIGPYSLDYCRVDFMGSCDSPFVAEGMGIVTGMELAATTNLKDVVLCSDSTEALWALNSGAMACDAAIDILKRGIALLEHYPGWRLTHIIREDNSITDMLAKKARVEMWCWDKMDAIPKLSWRPSDYL